jgi:hypothetical protein
MSKIGLIAAALMLAACASGRNVPGAWTALGYLAPSSTDNPEVIGEFDTEAACRQAVAAWMSRQVVGNPVSGDCLPTDRL